MYVMKPKQPMRSPFLLGLFLVIQAACNPANLQAAVANVSVVDFAFSPTSVTINVNDQVKWNFSSANQAPHTSTSDTGLWDSGIEGAGASFTHTFTSGGSFPYHCTVHPFMTASVTVQAVATNVPPTVSITAPANNTTFAAPWTGAIQATASDSDDTVSRVAFYDGTSLLGTVANPPTNLSFGVTNMPAGDHNLKAVATDSRGATNTSTVVTIHVLTPGPITLSSPARLSSTTFQFSYTATPGLSYIIRRSAELPLFSSIATNTPSSSPVQFIDNNAAGALSFYSITLAPNP